MKPFLSLLFSHRTRRMQVSDVSEREEYRILQANKVNCLLQTYQEVNDSHRSHTCCDDEIVRVDGNIDLPEQHFL